MRAGLKETNYLNFLPKISDFSITEQIKKPNFSYHRLRWFFSPAIRFSVSL